VDADGEERYCLEWFTAGEHRGGPVVLRRGSRAPAGDVGGRTSRELARQVGGLTRGMGLEGTASTPGHEANGLHLQSSEFSFGQPRLFLAVGLTPAR